jgi:DNA mismatch endonuclease (patch repair protein)
VSIAAPTNAHATATMRANRGTDTRPEVALRAALHRRGFRFRKNARLDLAPGRRVRPDIVFPKLRLAIFVDGCYWHGCSLHRSIPVSNTAFWRTKIEGTRERDEIQNEWLMMSGWTVIRVWEHEPATEAAERVIDTVMELRRRNRLR